MLPTRPLFARVPSLTMRAFSSATSSQYPTTGIEHADAMKAVGAKHARPPTEYKADAYHNGHVWTYYDVEVAMASQRLPQPNPKQPDVERTATNAPPKEKK